MMHISKVRGEWRLYTLRRRGHRGRGVIARGTFEEVCKAAAALDAFRREMRRPFASTKLNGRYLPLPAPITPKHEGNSP